jgi:hypothetical protein
MERKETGEIVFKNQEELEMYISAHFEEKYSKIVDYGFENGRKQAIEAIEQYPNLIGVNQFKMDIKAAIKAKKWYSEEEVKSKALGAYNFGDLMGTGVLAAPLEEFENWWKDNK